MPKYLYTGPADTFNGKPVPREGLKVDLTDAQRRALPDWHQFGDADTSDAEVKPTPQEVNDAANVAAPAKAATKPASA